MEKVYWIKIHDQESSIIRAEKVRRLIERSGMLNGFESEDMVGIKLHFGEKENDTHIAPAWVRPVVEELKKRGAKPFLTDTCVLYRGQRHNAVDHLMLAYRHGFTVKNLGAPVLIADGLLGNNEREVAVAGELFQRVALASAALEANGLVVMSHVTGHISTGMGAAIKNLGMGFASRKGKLRQHSVMKPAVSPKKCTGCGVCIEWCPADAIRMDGDKAVIDEKKCIGCGECLTVCRFHAVKHDWRMNERELQQRMAEHALGVVKGREKKISYLNFLTSITKDCDCFGKKQDPVIPDIGILAGRDPVAMDMAGLDLIERLTGKQLEAYSYPDTHPRWQIEHAEKVGLGSCRYELVEVD
ncbi:MAG TPA: DUF362 domain-containing protein [bacterium]|nr:DUF362 domain-containing protein [bacterium]